MDSMNGNSRPLSRTTDNRKHRDGAILVKDTRSIVCYRKFFILYDFYFPHCEELEILITKHKRSILSYSFKAKFLTLEVVSSRFFQSVSSLHDFLGNLLFMHLNDTINTFTRLSVEGYGVRNEDLPVAHSRNKDNKAMKRKVDPSLTKVNIAKQYNYSKEALVSNKIIDNELCERLVTLTSPEVICRFDRRNGNWRTTLTWDNFTRYGQFVSTKSASIISVIEYLTNKKYKTVNTDARAITAIDCIPKECNRGSEIITDYCKANNCEYPEYETYKENDVYICSAVFRGEKFSGVYAISKEEAKSSVIAKILNFIDKGDSMNNKERHNIVNAGSGQLPDQDANSSISSGSSLSNRKKRKEEVNIMIDNKIGGSAKRVRFLNLFK